MDSIICLIGADDEQKTILSKRLVNELNDKWYMVQYVSFRSKYFSNELNRIFKKITPKQPFGTIYPLILLVNVIIFYFTRIFILLKMGFIIICDRWIYDIIVDITVSIKNVFFYKTFLGRIFLLLSLKACLTLNIISNDDKYENNDVIFRKQIYEILTKRYSSHIFPVDGEKNIQYNILKNIISEKTDIDIKVSQKRIYAPIDFIWLRPLFKKKFFAYASNWLFQGTLIMTQSELLFRLVIELSFFIMSFMILIPFLPTIYVVLVSLLISHTLNWTFNGNMWVISKFFGMKYDINKNVIFLEGLKQLKLPFRNSVTAIVAFGSLSRGEFTDTSDIDVKLVKKKGLKNYIYVNVLAFYLRTKAFIQKIPLDLYIIDNLDQISKYVNSDEPLVWIFDPLKYIEKYGGTLYGSN